MLSNGVLCVGSDVGVITFTPNNLYSWNVYNLKTTYWWTRYTTVKKYKAAISTIATTTYKFGVCSTYYPYSYSDSYTIDPNTGVISLVDPKTYDNSITILGLSNVWIAVKDTSEWSVTSSRPEGIKVAPAGTATFVKISGNVYQTSGDNGRPMYLVTTDNATQLVAQSTYEKGTYVDKVSSSSSSTYPSNSYKGSYWYISDTSTTGPGTYIKTVYSTDPAAYPSDGEHSDGYWYTLN